MSGRACPSCLSPVSLRANYCPECGQRLPPPLPALSESAGLPNDERPAPQTSPSRRRETTELPSYDRSVPQAPQQYEYGRPTYGWGYEPPPSDVYEQPRRSGRLLPAILALGMLAALVALAAMLLLPGTGTGQAPSIIPSPTGTRLPTVTPELSPSDTNGESGQVPNGGRRLILRDTFEGPAGGWPDQKVENGAFHYAGGAYRISVNADRQILWTSTTELYADIDLAIDVTPISGPEGDIAGGLILREQGQSRFYAFQVRPDGTYAFRKSVGNGQWESLIDWETSGAIRQGQDQTNRLRVVARGNIFELYINDQLVNTIQDATYQEGFIGFGVSTFEQGGAVVEFDNLELRRP